MYVCARACVCGTFFLNITVYLECVYMHILVSKYAGISVPQVLQYLREFDVHAMQSCKPLPCGTGS